VNVCRIVIATNLLEWQLSYQHFIDGTSRCSLLQFTNTVDGSIDLLISPLVNYSS